MIKKLMLVTMMLPLMACSTVKTEPSPITVVTTPIIHPTPPYPVTMLPVEVMVANNEVIKDIALEIDKSGKEVALVILTMRNYENISLNLQELLRYINQQQKIIKYYRESTNTNALTRSNQTGRIRK